MCGNVSSSAPLSSSQGEAAAIFGLTWLAAGAGVYMYAAAKSEAFWFRSWRLLFFGLAVPVVVLCACARVLE